MDVGLDTSASQHDHYPVYVGIWTNWSRGHVLGSTLTLRRGDADLLIAFTAFFIAFVASRAWRVLCFTFHRLYSTASPQNTIYHQCQAIFRNSSSPENGIQVLLQLLWANRRSKGRSRPLLSVLVSILFISVFTVAGGFSSQISTIVGNEVLIKSSNCGYTKRELDDSVRFQVLAYEAAKISNAANYAQQCYKVNDTGFLGCGRFVTKRVGKQVDTEAGCPFADHLCRKESANLRIDSGYIDSHTILGLNAPLDERILFRSVLHCAPLTTTGYTDEKNTSLGTLTLYHYGSIIGTGEMDYVHAARSVESQYVVAKTNDIIVTNVNHAIT